MDKIVIDIETKNTFADVGGEKFLKDLQVSYVGLYSYNKDQFFGFFEHELAALRPIMQQAGLVIGFNMNHFDLPVLQKHFDFNLMALQRVDIFEELELKFGRRVGLNALAQANLGMGKSHSSGLEAIRLYKEQKFDELKDYCLQDVKLTRDLYDLIKKQKYLMVQDRDTGMMKKVDFDWPELVLPSTLF